MSRAVSVETSASHSRIAAFRSLSIYFPRLFRPQPIFGVVEDLTGSTRAAELFVNDIAPGQRMTATTVRLLRVLRGKSDAAQDVLFVRDDFKMRGIDAGAIATQMIKN